MATGGSDEYQDHVCEPCGVLSKKPPGAVMYCNICDQMLCQNCVKQHQQNQILKDHPLEKNDKLSASFRRKPTHPIALCDKHKTERLDDFCKTHNVLLCSKCSFLWHKDCEVTGIKEMARLQKQSKLMGESIKYIEGLQQKMQQIRANLDQGRQSLKKMKDKSLAELRTLKKELDALILKLENEAIDDIDNSESDMKSEIDQQIREGETLLDQIEECKALMEDCRATNDENIMFIAMTKSKDDIKKMGKLLNEIQASIVIPELKFQTVVDVIDLKTTLKRLGTVNTGKPEGLNVDKITLKRTDGKSVDAVAVGRSGGKPMDATVVGRSGENPTDVTADRRSKGKLSDVIAGGKSGGKPMDVTAVGRYGIKPVEDTAVRRLGKETMDASTAGRTKTITVEKTAATKSGGKDTSPAKSSFNVLEKEVTKLRHLSVDSSYISGSTFLENGELILCDRNNKILLLSSDLSMKGHLPLPERPWDAAAIAQTIVVTLPDSGRLQYVDVRPKLAAKKILKLGEKCHGVTSASGKFFVIVGAGQQSDILVLGPDGTQQTKILLLLGSPLYIALNKTGTKIWISHGIDSVSCLDTSGTSYFRYRSDDLPGPAGMLVDDNDNLVVCGSGSNSIHVVTSDGKFARDLIPDAEREDRPITVSYRAKDETLVVGMRGIPGCTAFTFM